MWVSLILLGAISLCIHLLYKAITSKKNYWELSGVRFIDASSVASGWDIFTGKKGLIVRDNYTYKLLSSYGEKWCGQIENGINFLFVKDIEMIKKVLIKDFDYFPERRDFFAWAREDSAIKKMYSVKQGEEWKNLRHTLSPAFTTGKIRRMMEAFNNVGKEWTEDLRKRANKSSVKSVTIEVMKCVNQYTVDVIAQAVFGLNAGSIQNPDSEFAKAAYKFSDNSPYKFVLAFQFPRLARLLGIEIFNGDSIKWMEKILDQGLQQRLSGEVKNNDFLQLLVEAKKGELKAVGDDELNDFERDAQTHLQNGKKILLTNDVMNAQSILFFIGGFSTTSTFITFALYALAAYPDAQERLRKEVETIVKGNGDIDYDEVGQIAYMEMFICEVFRLYSPVLRLERICKKDYTDPETGLHIPKETFVNIPVKSLHTDPEYFPNPDKFDPEGHFSPEMKAKRSPYTFIPFGHGPRNCIGMRFALIEAKAAIAHIVHSFLVLPTEKTPLPMTADETSLQALPPPGLELKLIPREF